VHHRHAEDQIEALILVWQEQIGAQVIEALLRKVVASGFDQVFTSVDSNEPSLRWVEDRRPAAHTGAYLQNIERNCGISPTSRSSEPWFERRGLNTVNGLVRAWVATRAVGSTGGRSCRPSLQHGTNRLGYIAWIVACDRYVLASGPAVSPAQLIPKGTLRSYDAIEESETLEEHRTEVSG
jgi:hypothetical protein